MYIPRTKHFKNNKIFNQSTYPEDPVPNPPDDCPDMPRIEQKYISAFDGLQLLYRCYRNSVPGWAPRASLCLVHGFGEHSERFSAVCEAFVAHGLVVHTIDLRGHGYSGGGRGMI